MLETGSAHVVYENRDGEHFVHIYFIERRAEEGKTPEDTIRRLVLPYFEAMRLSHEIREVLSDAGVSHL